MPLILDYYKIIAVSSHIILMGQSMGNGQNYVKILKNKMNILTKENIIVAKNMENGISFIDQLKIQHIKQLEEDVMKIVVQNKVNGWNLIFNLKRQTKIYSIRENITKGKEQEDGISYQQQKSKGQQKFSKHFLIKSGGGYFDLNGIKYGYWVELHANFSLDPIPYHYPEGFEALSQGNYINGKRVSKWKTNYLTLLDNYSFRIIDIDFDDYNERLTQCTQKERKYKSLFQSNIAQKLDEFQDFQSYLSASLDEIDFNKVSNFESMPVKTLDDDYLQKQRNVKYFYDFPNDSCYINQLFSKRIQFQGYQVDQDKKIGEWKTNFNYSWNQIGGGFFDENSIKQDKWIEFHFKIDNKLIYFGDYYNGKRVGRWDTFLYWYESKDYKVIGGGQFNVNGLKNGEWKEVYLKIKKHRSSFEPFYLIINNGEYKNGKKIGKWETFFCEKQFNCEYNTSQLINIFRGGGSYDENSLKYDLWIEMHNIYDDQTKIIYFGEYNKGLKVGEWNYMNISGDSSNYTIIDGGMFNSKRQKNGKWQILKQNQNYHQSLLLQSERKEIQIQIVHYKNGKRIFEQDKYQNNL